MADKKKYEWDVDRQDSEWEEEEKRIADLDYEKAYKNVYSIGGDATNFVKAPRVMTIFRMFVSLNDINVLVDPRLGEVEELVVVADVVAIDGNIRLKIPGTKRVVIVCRLIVGNGRQGPKDRKDDAAIVVQLSLLQNDKVSPGLILEERKVKGYIDVYCTTPKYASGEPTQLFVYSQGVKITAANNTISRRSTHENLCFNQVITNFQSTKPYKSDKWDLKFSSRRCTNATAVFDCLSLYTADGTAGDLYGFRDEVYQDKLSFGLSMTGVDRVPAHLLENERVVMGLEATLLSAEAILLYGRKAGGDGAEEGTAQHIKWEGALQYCKWIVTHALANRSSVKKGSNVPEDEALRVQLQSLYIRSQALITLYGSGTLKVLVPPLNYKLYRDSIEQVAVAARLYDDELKATVRQIQAVQTTELAAEHVIGHVKSSAAASSAVVTGYFTQHFKVLAEKEKDVEEYSSRVAGLHEIELGKAQTELDRLKGIMIVQKEDMSKAEARMKSEQVAEAQKQKAKAAWGIFSAVLQIGLAVVTMGASAAGAIDAVAKIPERLEKLQEVLEKLKDVMEALEKLKDLLESKPGQNVEMPTMPEAPSDSDWTVFVQEVEQAVNGIPEDAIPSAGVFKTKCKNVAAVGREISIVAIQIATLRFQLKLLEWQKEMAVKQRERLDTIQPIELDTSAGGDTNNVTINGSTLQEILVQLDMRAMRMTISLIEMLNVQNGALYYHYLQKPQAIYMATPTIYNVQQLLIDRDRNTVAWNEMVGKSALQKRDFVISNIPVAALKDGMEFRFNMKQEEVDFPKDWQRVRIRHLQLRFTGNNRPTTTTGEVFLALIGDRVFFDRYKGEVFQYEAAKPLKYPYAYNLDTEKTTFDNRDITTEEDNFMRMTPFTRWKLLVPKTAYENAGIRFAQETVTEVTITFHVTVVRNWAT